MLVAVSAVTALGLLDQQREAAKALDDFSREQSVLATAVAAEVRTRLELHARVDPHASTSVLLEDVLAGVRHVEVPSALILLVGPPRDAGFVATDGRIIPSERLLWALDAGAAHVMLERDEAAQVGLPARIAAAGLARVEDPQGGVWRVVVIESAQRLRDRQERARVRLALGLVLATGLVLAFGGVALWLQRKELGLERELAVRALELERDAQLQRADKMATLAALSTGIGHELATPLAVILGRAEQLEGRFSGDERARRSLDAIIEQVDRIKRIMRGFLALARGEAPSLEQIAPADLIRAAVGLVRHRFTKARVELDVDADEGLPHVPCDPPLVEQALVNLLLNACEACEPGGLVEISAHMDGEKLVFLVTDDGAGITDDDASRACEPFFTTKPSGTGLGLAIANEIVKHHGGVLSLRARTDRPPPARGTQAAVTLQIASE